jgi:hypothetical protein
MYLLSGPAYEAHVSASLRPFALGTGNPSSILVALSFEGEMHRNGSLQTRCHFGVDLCLLHILRDGGGPVSLRRPHHPSCCHPPTTSCLCSESWQQLLTCRRRAVVVTLATGGRLLAVPGSSHRGEGGAASWAATL